ncbi:MAG: nucleotidyl transferase AbiEii/AbiGii toxin family protein [Prosthecobacter sp.]|uniref:nucleotidyl transferase AbiEii/AbiGii toxin family protein n=1 Tax=Prosthecobacter sp. TaxID=1965333 RepID=UPI0025D629F2|nr:nucleotidyl transferase AbiEii/AbiGii toxin family protein [Prosthecobacter sp.]MCF7786030.1 nucleotidyl transferase AbiEii/AbiGii toxin family protein [Prosthecobacter sp.]
MKDSMQHDIAEWVNQAPSDQRELRQAVHTVLAAIAQDTQLRADMIMKGGILLAVRYQSGRFTKDIDFSTSLKLSEVNPDEVQRRLDAALRLTVESLDYDLDCRVQGCKVQPANQVKASFPSIKLKIGYAYKGTAKHRRLIQLQSTSVISIDYSLNESISNTDEVLVGLDQSVNAYPFAELVAEKFRALLQQVERDRYRRQDVYDLAFLSRMPRKEPVEVAILESLMVKARSRNIEPNRDSLNDEEVKRRAAADYHTLKDEVQGDLPDFELAYAEVLSFYRALPW